MTRGRIIGATAAAVCALCAPGVAYFEGMVPHTYSDPAGIPTICYGHTGPDVVPGRTATLAQCESLMGTDMQRALNNALDCVYADLTPPQAAALTSFTMNVGKSNLCRSTLARLANAGAAPSRWCSQMMRWTYTHIAGVAVQIPGLVKRRRAETALCLGHIEAWPS